VDYGLRAGQPHISPWPDQLDRPVVDGKWEMARSTRVARTRSLAIMLSCVAQQDLHGIAAFFGFLFSSQGFLFSIGRLLAATWRQTMYKSLQNMCALK